MKKFLSFLIFSSFIFSCSGDPVSEQLGIEEENESVGQDSTGMEDLVHEPAEILTLEAPFNLSFELGEEEPSTLEMNNLPSEIERKLTLPKDWMHPAGFDFSDGISSGVIGLIEEEPFDVYITFHSGYETTMAGYFDASFYMMSVFDQENNLLGQQIVAGYEKLKDGGMGYQNTYSCKYLEGMSFNITTAYYEYDFEDGEDYEDESSDVKSYQIDTDGEIFFTPE